MSFLNRLIQTIQPGYNTSGSKQDEVILREQIKRNKKFLIDFKEWKKQNMHQGLLDHLKSNFLQKQLEENKEVNLYTLNLTNAKGFYFRAEQPWNTEDYEFLIQHFILQLKDIGYFLTNSTREVLENQQHVTAEELFYLKPSLKYRKELPYNQLFGNVELHHQIIDEKSDLIKVTVHTYTDRNFQKALDFEDFIHQIFLS